MHRLPTDSQSAESPNVHAQERAKASFGSNAPGRVQAPWRASPLLKRTIGRLLALLACVAGAAYWLLPLRYFLLALTALLLAAAIKAWLDV